MAEYIEREALLTDICDDMCGRKYTGVCENCRVVALIADAPAADVAPVVHCKGCEHAERYERTDGTVGYYCGHPQNTFAYGERWDRVFKPVKEADDFCSYGERRMDGGDGDAKSV